VDQTYLTASKVARQLGLSAERVRQFARSGRLAPDLVIDGCRYWLSETVDRFEASRAPTGRFEVAPSRPRNEFPEGEQ
jgi:hypothetical protein